MTKIRNTPTTTVKTAPVGMLMGLAAFCVVAASAGAQPAWLRSRADHLLCCGPKAGSDENDPTLNRFLGQEDILADTKPATMGAEATLALGPTAASPVATTAASSETKPAPKVQKPGEVLTVGFDRLASFEFTPPEDPAKAEAAEAQIPAAVRELNAMKVAVTGFMLPVKMDSGLVTEFLLVKDAMMCCYGAMPKVNEWVVVKMTGKGVAPLMDVPITFEGTLQVGQIYESGYLTGLYLLKGERRVETKG
jgi:hypothetical protein